MTFKLALAAARAVLLVVVWWLLQPERYTAHMKDTHTIQKGYGEELCTLSAGAEYAAFSSHFELIFGPLLP